MRIKIATVGEAILRTEARPLTHEEIRSATTRELIEHMRETLHDAPGVGLAAPQIGLPLQFAVIEDKAEYQSGLSVAELAERERRPIPFHVIINLARFHRCSAACPECCRRMSERVRRPRTHPSGWMVCPHSAARDRSSEGNALYRPHAKQQLLLT